jgi:acyl-CoA thioesterase-1
MGNSGTRGNVLYAMRKWVLGMGESKARRLGAAFVAAAALLAGACGAPPDGVGSAAPAPGADRPAATSAAPAPAAAVPAADPAAPAPATARPRLVVLGDSIAAGYGLRREESFPARLQERIDREGLGFEVVNAGVSGDTSAGGLRRLDWALDGDVRVLVVELGGNDGLRGLPPEELKKNLTAIVQAARERHLAVLLCGMEAPPNAGPAYTTAFREAFSSVARDERVPFVRFVLDKVAGVEGLNQEDGIHPNARGARLVADTVWPALQPLLEAASRS